MAPTMLGLGYKSVSFTLAFTEAELLKRQSAATAAQDAVVVDDDAPWLLLLL